MLGPLRGRKGEIDMKRIKDEIEMSRVRGNSGCMKVERERVVRGNSGCMRVKRKW